MIKTVRAAGGAAHTGSAVLDQPLRPSDAEVAELAYSFWEARGFQDGSPEEDWLRAERELMRVNELKRED